MALLNSMRSKSQLAMFTVSALLFLSCRTEYTTQHFSFPPGSQPHEANWEYTALVVVSSKQKPISKKSEKNVQIKVYDKAKTTFLYDDIEVVSASIRAKVIWKTFERIEVELFEVGNEYAKDPYNIGLLKSGPKALAHLTYQYDQTERKFKKTGQ